jgi:hypothetical protein
MDPSAPLQSNDPNQVLREQAINWYIAGEQPSVICRRLGRSRTWFYNTLKRYQRGGRAGLVSQSGAPKRVSNRTDEAVEAAIVRVRQAIMAGDEPALRYANIGAEMIASELQRAKMTPPSRATIHRILRRHHLVQVRPRSPLKRRLPADYPWPCVKRPNALHLLDFVIRAGAGVRRFYSCHLLDQARRWPFLRIITAKQVAEVSQFLVSAWQEIGLPGALYLDNDVVWAGSSSAPRTISHIVRLCLLLGVEVIFIPPYTPEANPIIESFNRLWDRNFWQRTTFEGVPHLEQELGLFENYCRYRRPLAELAGWTADQLDPIFEPCRLAATFDQQQPKRLPLTAGLIHFIRFVDSEGLFTILNETWSLPLKLADKTIRATVDTQQQRLLVYHQPRPDTSCDLVTEFDYPLAEKVIALSSEYIRPHVPLWSVNSSFDC